MSPLASSIGDHYQILEQLGEGSIATVYKAFDARLERYVAIKVFLPLWKDSDRFLKHFEGVARNLAGLSHPNIVKLLDYGQREGLPYLITDYLPGGTLKQRLGSPLPWQEASRLIIPIANALAYIHQNKIIHRDITPSNILISTTGEPVLSDYGIAEIMEMEETTDSTDIGIGFVTPAYMSPEQAAGSKADTRSDIYSLGVVYYEMIAGRKPFEAETPMATLMSQIGSPPPMPRKFRPDLPVEVEEVILATLAKHREDRFQSMQEFEVTLRHLVDNPLEKQSALARPAVEWKPTAVAAKPDSVPPQDSFFRRVLRRLNGNPTTDVPPPRKRKNGD